MNQKQSQTHESKTKILDSAIDVIRTKGYTATRIEDICIAAGLTKGGFFHHFKSKEDLALAAADRFSEMAEDLFSSGPYRKKSDPVDRLLGYVDFRKGALKGDLPDFTCLFGMMIQETFETHPEVSNLCGEHIEEHAAVIAKDIEEAKTTYSPQSNTEGLELFTQAVVQGAFILAKAKRDSAIAAQCFDHLRQYIELIFRANSTKEEKTFNDKN